MKQKMKKEVIDLASSILQNISDDDTLQKLTIQCRNLYEKLVIYNHLNESQSDDLPIKEITSPQEQKTSPLMVSAVKEIQVGLNDRLAFVVNLFGNDPQAFEKVLAEIQTKKSLQDVLRFIEENVKTQYDWSSKQAYQDRFMQLITSKF